jgi:hypothetical protein
MLQKKSTCFSGIEIQNVFDGRIGNSFQGFSSKERLMTLHKEKERDKGKKGKKKTLVSCPTVRMTFFKLNNSRNTSSSIISEL